MTPHAQRRRAAMPRAAAMSTAPTTIMTLRTSLSASPNRLTMRSLAPGGWRSMTRSPMAMTNDGAPETSAAMSSATPMVTAAAMAPANAAAMSALRLVDGCMALDTCVVGP